MLTAGAIVTGEALKPLAMSVAQYEARDCFPQLLAYLRRENNPRLCALYGLRRTGKTVLLFQAIRHLGFSGCAYIRLNNTVSMTELSDTVDTLRKSGSMYIFLDEITLMPDFIQNAAVLSDIYAAMGMHIVLAGTDSLSFMLASESTLYDRVQLIHTSYISFREHSRLLHTTSIDDFVRYGGTLVPGRIDLEGNIPVDATFRDDISARQYTDSAIAHNILNGLRYDSRRGVLSTLIEKNELVPAILAVVRSLGSKHLLSVVNDPIALRAVHSARQLLKLHGEKSTDFNETELQTLVQKQFHIQPINDQLQPFELTEPELTAILSYLTDLDILIPISELSFESQKSQLSAIDTLTQPGLKMCQAAAIVGQIRNNPSVISSTATYAEHLCKKIEQDILGHIQEDQILIDTLKCLSQDFSVCKCKNHNSEFDMLVYSRKTESCIAFEIKHSTECIEAQCKHLLNTELCKCVERMYGNIKAKCVLYNGQTCVAPNGVIYKNVTEYLLNIPEFLSTLFIQSESSSVLSPHTVAEKSSKDSASDKSYEFSPKPVL